LLYAGPDLLRGRKVTCTHNLICDIDNSDGEAAYSERGDRRPLGRRRPRHKKASNAVAQLMAAVIQELEKEQV